MTPGTVDATAVRARVVAACSDSRHAFSKPPRASIRLIEGIGVEGDSHAGRTVQHRSRVRRDPTASNLRQVHLLSAELLAELRDVGFPVGPGELGENVTTLGVDLMRLPRGALVRLGGTAVVEVTGLRNPCRQIDDFARGLLTHVLRRDDAGRLVRRAGVMGVVREGGVVRPGDSVSVACPASPYHALDVI